MPSSPFLAGWSKANLYSWNILPGRSWRWPLILCVALFPYQRPDIATTHITLVIACEAMLYVSFGVYYSTYSPPLGLHTKYIFTTIRRARIHAQIAPPPLSPSSAPMPSSPYLGRPVKSELVLLEHSTGA